MAALAFASALPAGASVEHLLPPVKQMASKPGGSFALNRLVAVADPTSFALLAEVLAAAGAPVADELSLTLDTPLPADERNAQIEELSRLLDAFRSNYASAGINLPAEGMYYNLSTPLRGNRFATEMNGALSGADVPSAASAWTFRRRNDGSFDIVNYDTNHFVAPTAANNTQLTVSNTEPSAGWMVKPADEVGSVIIVSGAVQFNQTNLQNKVYNWGGGSNISDTGCKYAVRLSEFQRQQVAITDVETKGQSSAAVFRLIWASACRSRAWHQHRRRP